MADKVIKLEEKKKKKKEQTLEVQSGKVGGKGSIGGK
jgi:hypothetical protein